MRYVKMWYIFFGSVADQQLMRNLSVPDPKLKSERILAQVSTRLSSQRPAKFGIALLWYNIDGTRETSPLSQFLLRLSSNSPECRS